MTSIIHGLPDFMTTETTDFAIINFQRLDSNIPTTPAYDVYISQLIHVHYAGINSNTSSNTTYKPTSLDKDEILANHRSFMTSLNIPSGKKSEDLPYLYWIPKNSIRHHTKKGT